jgi:hypothetical protein
LGKPAKLRRLFARAEPRHPRSTPPKLPSDAFDLLITRLDHLQEQVDGLKVLVAELQESKPPRR